MVLDGVSVDDRIVRRLAEVVERPLAHKLEQALFFSAEIVSLTPQERTAVLAAFERLPWEYDDVRESFLAGAGNQTSLA
jgi:hypothetical protein